MTPYTLNEWERLSDENDRLREERDFLLALSDDQNTLNEQLTDEIGRYREALERIRDEYADSFTWQLHDIADAALDGSA